MKQVLIWLTLACMIGAVSAQSKDDVLGRWITVDDKTKKVRSVVEIYKQGNKAYGKIVKLVRSPEEDPDPHCTACDEDDPRYNKRVTGMVIIEDMEWDDDIWDDGEILDPKSGDVYDCKFKVIKDGKLEVRGYLGLSLLGRTQYWWPDNAASRKSLGM